MEIKVGSALLLQSVPLLSDKKDVHIQKLKGLSGLLGTSKSVWGIQVRLLSLGYDCGSVDGKLNAMTHEALKKFESDNGLEPEPNGKSSAQIERSE